MEYPIYAIRDSKVGFMTPTVDQNDASAARNFEHAVMNSASLMNSHPGDYELYRIGTYETDSGEIHPEMPVHIASAFDVVVRSVKE